MLIVRRVLRVLLMTVAAVIVVVGVLAALTQTSWFKARLRDYIVRESGEYLNGRLSIQKLDGNLFSGIELENVELSIDDNPVVVVQSLALDYRVAELVTRGISLDYIRLNKPVVYLRRKGGGWSIGRLLKRQAREADREGPKRPITIGDIGISDGSIVFDERIESGGVDLPKRFERFDARLSFKYEPVRYSIDISHISFRGHDPEIALSALSGGFAVADDTLYLQKVSVRTQESSLSIEGAIQQYLNKPILNIRVSSDKLSLPELSPVVRSLSNVRLQPAFELMASGPFDRLDVYANVRSAAGQVVGNVTTNLGSSAQSVAGKVSLSHLNLAPFFSNNPERTTDITADGDVNITGSGLSNLSSLRGSVRLTAPRIVVGKNVVAERIEGTVQVTGRQLSVDSRASGYGANGTAKGIVTIPQADEPWTFDLNGRAYQMDLRNLPRDWKVPPAATDIAGDYHVVRRLLSAPGGSLSSIKLPISISGEATFLQSTIAGARIAEGGRASFSLSGSDLAYQADATVADVDLQEIGEAFDLEALAADRYRSELNGHVVASVEGTKVEEMTITASGTLTDSTMFRIRAPRATFEVRMAENTIHANAQGQLAADPAVATGNAALGGDLVSDVDVVATLSDISEGLTLEGVDLTAKASLLPSTIAGVSIENGSIDGDLRNDVFTVRTFDVKGRDLNLSATGKLALNDNDQSDLRFQADSASLDEIGMIFDKPLKGIARIDGTVTGNKRELKASGNFNGNGVAYGSTSALTMTTKYDARVAELAFDRARVSGETAATFVTLAGQNVNELSAKTEYDNRQINFDATAKQAERSLTTAGALVLHPDHQEIHLQKLDLEAQGSRWQLRAGTQPAIQYGGNVVSVDRLELVSGDQGVSATGAFGESDRQVMVALENLDLATLDALLLRQPQFSGRLNGTVTIGGTREVPEGNAVFTVKGGGFRQFRYETFTATADFRDKGINLDATLQQNATSSITAKGYVPTALFRGDISYVHAESPDPADRIDLHVESTPIDLGVVQGFTTAVTNVTGIARATIDIGGSAGDPHPTGVISIENGAFRVERTGVTYTGVGGRVDLLSDRLHIDEIKVLDNRQHVLTVGGDLALHEFDVGDVNLTIRASDFKVIDNATGSVRIDTDMHVAGELRQPRIEGSLAMTSGTLDLDRIMASFGGSAYAIKPTEYAAEKGGSDESALLSRFDPLAVDVHFTVPNNLVVKGQDLQPSGSPIGLGALNLTFRGDMWISKVPYDRVRLTGVINTVRGTYNFQGRRFEILRDGTVRFDGLDELNPTLDITTQRVIQAVTANVNIKGTFRKPEIVMTSIPPLEEADILALIVFNQPLNQLGEGSQASVAQRAQALATGAAVGQLSQSIARVLNIDTFEISTLPDDAGAAELTVGQQVGPNLYVKVQQGIGDQSQTNLILEYELTRWLRLRTNVLQGSSTQQQLFQRVQGSGADLLFFFSY
jgi:autotransporter translocation and assembly factor TamB